MSTLFGEPTPEKPWMNSERDDFGFYRNIVIRVRNKDDYDKLNELMDGVLSRKPDKVIGFDAYQWPDVGGSSSLEFFGE
jgi:hypothetical protein